jgi:hypothetical protein
LVKFEVSLLISLPTWFEHDLFNGQSSQINDLIWCPVYMLEDKLTGKQASYEDFDSTFLATFCLEIPGL